MNDTELLKLFKLTFSGLLAFALAFPFGWFLADVVESFRRDP